MCCHPLSPHRNVCQCLWSSSFHQTWATWAPNLEAIEYRSNRIRCSVYCVYIHNTDTYLTFIHYWHQPLLHLASWDHCLFYSLLHKARDWEMLGTCPSWETVQCGDNLALCCILLTQPFDNICYGDKIRGHSYYRVCLWDLPCVEAKGPGGIHDTQH